MDQSFLEQRSEQPSDAASPRVSSAVMSASHDGRDAHAESSEPSSPSLKERDYIGLAEVSSMPFVSAADDNAELNLSETDLRLGLGPATQSAINGIDKVSEVQKSVSLDQISSRASCVAMFHKQDDSIVPLRIQEGATVPDTIPSSWQRVPMKSLADVIPVSHVKDLVSSSKNGGKRLYAEAMVDVLRDPMFILNMSSSPATAESRSCASPITPTSRHFQVQDRKVQYQGGFWVPSQVPAGQSQANYGLVARRNGMGFLSVAGDVDGEGVRNAVLAATTGNEGSRVVQPIPNKENVPDEAPPAKGQVVGWPPVRTYRRSTLTMQSKPTGDEGDSQSAVYVKVNMDGIPIGRKVDLNAYKSYETLLSGLEDMFHNLNSGLGARFLKGSEFVLTYEDKEGDWMLVGDVPWGMFVNTVRRLRITRGSDVSGFGSRTPHHA